MTLLDFFDLLRLALLLTALLLILLGRRAVLVGKSEVAATVAGPWPEVALIVPAAGNPPALSACVRSLLGQDYPCLQVVFVTRDSADEANGVILQEIEGNPRARLLHSGRSERCGQKNHSLLAGIRAVGVKPEILAFCDSTRIARPSWLKGLVSPLCSGARGVTSGYHHVIPRDRRIATLGHACSVLILYLTKGIGPMNQPWGGATAIRRDLFEALGVPAVWERNVVDDVSLGACLKRNRIPVAFSPGSCLETPVSDESFQTWNRWLIRQWLYLKFCFPLTWLAAGLCCHLFSAAMLVSAGIALAGAAGWAGGGEAAHSILFLLFLVVLAGSLRGLLPFPAPRFHWLGACFFTILLASWSHLLTLPRRELSWKSILYKVSEGGVVEEVMDQARGKGDLARTS